MKTARTEQEEREEYVLVVEKREEDKDQGLHTKQRNLAQDRRGIFSIRGYLLHTRQFFTAKPYG